jgi:exopolysaccharide biosynthesis polyprenyl glycosylphosphotransferase
LFRRFSPNFAVLSIFLDAALVVLALRLAVALRPALSALPFVRDIPTPTPVPAELYIIFPVLWIGVLLLFAVYDGRRHLRVTDEFASLTFSALLAAISMAGVLYLTYRDISRFLYLLFIALAFGMMLAWRTVYRLAYRRNLIRSSSNRRVLVLGFGATGKRLGQTITAHASALTLAGYLDDDPAKLAEGFPVLGPLDAARAIIVDHSIDDVVLALPGSAHQRVNQIVTDLHTLPVRVWIIPDYFALTLHKAQVEEFAGIPMLDVRAPALTEDQRMLKRAFDLVVTCAALPFLLPIFGLIALAIKLDSPGPVFFRARRIGENGCTFGMLKFRTMVADAEQLLSLALATDPAGNRVYKTPADPRITRIGRLLRRTSMDELPQLINVLRGQMSLVGPRPEQPFLVDQYAPWQRKRFAVPQGITGWWQVNGRSDRPMHLHTEDDLYYVQHYSIWLDLQIIARTVWAVLRGKGAY